MGLNLEIQSHPHGIAGEQAPSRFIGKIRVELGRDEQAHGGKISVKQVRDEFVRDE